MDTHQTEQTTPEPDGPAGLETGGPTGLGPRKDEPPREPEVAIDALAAGEMPREGEEDALLAHYFSHKPKPGTTTKDRVEVEVDLGRSGAKWKCTLKPILWSNWQESQLRGEKTDGTVNPYAMAAWNVAQALVKPELGRIVSRLHDEASRADDGKITDPNTGEKKDPPEHAPALLMDFFAAQSGALLELSAKVLEISRLQNQNAAVKEVEAGKG